MRSMLNLWSGTPEIRPEQSGYAPLLRLRILEIAAFALIVLVARWITGLQVPGLTLLVILVVAASAQLALKFLVREERTIDGGALVYRAPRSVLWSSTAIDMMTVLTAVYLTGGVESPFLTLILVPVFFGSRLLRDPKSGIQIALIMSAALICLFLLEWKGPLPHRHIYPDWGGETLGDLRWGLGTIVIITGMMCLVVYLAVVFQDHFAVDSEETLQNLKLESERKLFELNKLHDISMGINAAMSLDNLLKLVAREATLLISASWSCVLLFNRDGEVTYGCVLGLDQDRLDCFKTIEDGDATDSILKSRTPKLVHDVRADRESRSTRVFGEAGIGAYVAVPAITANHVNGIIYVGEFEKRDFKRSDSFLLSVLGSQLAAAVEKSRVYEALERKIKRITAELEELANANKLKSDFVSHVSHELKTPLTSIKAYIETLRANIGNPDFPEAEGFLDIVGSETERLIRIVKKILDVSQIEFGKRLLNREVFDLGRLIEELEADFMPTLKERGIFFLVEIPADLPKLDADRDLVKQVFVNLIGNALKFSPNNSRLHVRAWEEAVSIRISVRDEGIGIPKEDLMHVFEQFYKVREHEEVSTEGTGLGLAIVKNIVESHGGSISAESETGKGTTFTFGFPKEHCFNPRAARVFDLIEDRRRLRQLFETMVRAIAEVFSAKIVSLMLLEDDDEKLHIQVAYGLDESVVHTTTVKKGEGISGQVVDRGVPILIENIERNEIYRNINNPQYETVSLISAPLFVKDRCIGVLNVNNKTSKHPFDQDDLNLLVMLCERVSRILERLTELEDPQAYIDESISAFTSIIENRRNRLFGKGDATVRLAAKVSRKLGLNEKEVSVIQYVASVHDIGMIRVSEEILNKVVELTPTELEQIRKHPEESAKILRPLEFVEMVSQNILYHHECMDGSGYPMGLKGAEIPIGARVIGVIDAYESMTSSRPYRRAMSPRQATEEIVRCSGTQFDPAVVKAFLETLLEDGLISPDVLSKLDQKVVTEKQVSHPVP